MGTSFPGYTLDKRDKWGRCFFSLINISLQMLIHECYHFSVDQWFDVCVVVRTGNFRVFSRTGLLFGLGQSFLFLSNQQLLDFQSCFSFPEANCWASLASFSKLLFGEITFWTMTDVWLRFKGTIPCRSVSKVIFFSFQRESQVSNALISE